MDTEYTEVLVIGGGPAGSSAASFLAKNSRKVVLLEKESFPRHHIGESTLPGLVKLLDIELGLGSKLSTSGFLIKTGASYVWGKDRIPWSFHFWESLDKDRVAYEVDRSKFDDILLRYSENLGVNVREKCYVNEIIFEKGRVIGVSYKDKNLQTHAIRSQYVIDASGLSSIIARKLNSRKLYERIRNIAIYGYWEAESLPYTELGGDLSPNDSSNILVITHNKCWFWIIPLANNRVSVGLVLSMRDIPLLQEEGIEKYYFRNIRECTELSKVLLKAKFIQSEPLRTLQDWSQISERMIGPGYIMCGDSAAFVDPILSSGVTLAVTFGLIAGRIINTLLEYGDEEIVHKWYQHAYNAAYNNFRSMADFWYLGSGRKEDWFNVALEQIIKDAEIKLNKRNSFIHLASGTFTTGELYQRECYVEGECPLTVFFSPIANPAFFSPSDREIVSDHLIDIPKKLIQNQDTLIRNNNLQKSKLETKQDNPILNSDVRIGIYSKAGDPFLRACVYQSQSKDLIINGKFLPIPLAMISFFKMLNGNYSIDQLSGMTGIDKDLILSILSTLNEVGLMH